MWGARGKIVVDYVATPHGGRVGGVGWGGGSGLHQNHVVLPRDQDERDAATEHE